MHYMNGAPAIGATDGRLRLCGERRLMLAVLENALRTITGARLGRTRIPWLKRELAWFLSHDRSHPFAFECLCEALDIDADWLRGRALDATAHLTRGQPTTRRERRAAEAVA